MKLTRYHYADDCTLGHLVVSDDLTLYTIERPWLQNQQYVSCIPAGTYELSQHTSDRHGETVAMVNPSLNVHHWPQGDSSRSVCLIHVANFAHQLEGCIAVGMVAGPMRSSGRNKVLQAVRSSGQAMDLLRPHLKRARTLIISP